MEPPAHADRIKNAFLGAQKKGRAALVAYICGGDPSPETSAACAAALLEVGVDILEIGVPFSDPLADGETNQLAAQRALAAGMNRGRLFKLASDLRKKFPRTPVVLYTYYNLVLARGLEAFARDCREAGVDGILTLDLPPEEAAPLDSACRAQGIANIYIVAPTTPEARIREIAARATGFIYYVSQEGVTGERRELAANLAEKIAAIKRHTPLPVVAGFGISTPEHIAKAGACADGVVVGSALVRVIAENAATPGAIPLALSAKIHHLLGGKSA
ncbi:MAG: tryptophan synthase subunit alpha [Puniceicoccales bacterium]|jgi:tryptophan synthase alpha chain|nr:tryptophan synthase subunit alpha [Puniceicoccales bacterium]